MSYPGSPPPPLSRATLVIGLYTAMGIVAFLLAAGRGDPDVYRLGGSPAGWQLATTLRKGTKHWYGSIDSQLTYPLSKLLGSAWGGYVWVGYFNGYGEDILDYNNRQHWVARIGYSISR